MKLFIECLSSAVFAHGYTVVCPKWISHNMIAMRYNQLYDFLRSFISSSVLNQGIRPSWNELSPKEIVWPTQTAWRDTVWERRKVITLLFTTGWNCIKQKMDIQSTSDPSKQITMANTDQKHWYLQKIAEWLNKTLFSQNSSLNAHQPGCCLVLRPLSTTMYTIMCVFLCRSTFVRISASSHFIEGSVFKSHTIRLLHTDQIMLCWNV